MPSYNKQTIFKQAQKFGFIRDTFEKMLRLAEMLKFFSGDPLLSKSLALKGGTAINLIIFNKKDSFDLQSAQKDVTDYLTRLLVIDDNERRYLEAFKSGEYKPELLFEDNDVVQRIRNHPMALWKMQNYNR